MRTLWITAAAVALSAHAFAARADCAMSVGYQVTEEPAGYVRICLLNFDGRKCPDQGLLRRARDARCTATAGAMLERCVDVEKLTSCDADGCFVDECVPAGTYQYGLAKPYACNSASCETSYFQEVKVTGAAADCARLTPPPENVATVPWSSEPLVCSYGGSDGGGCSTGSSVLGFDLAALAAGLGLWRLRARRRPRA